MLKKALIASAIAASFGTLTLHAEEAPVGEKWVGIFGQYYDADSGKPKPGGYFEDGNGIGGEFGYRFDPDWAVRFELIHQDLDVDPVLTPNNDESGNSFGLDMLYYLNNDAAYLFGGLRHQALDESYRSLAAGIGKHWSVNERWSVITEAAAFHDFGQGYNDFALKLGLAYRFGKTAAKRDGDADNDGVKDSMDKCPMTPAGVSVDAMGCDNDHDKDGVINSLDQCPNTLAGLAVNSSGCALIKDGDKDGVADRIDQCLDTPSGDKVDATGCTIFAEHQVAVVLNVLFANDSAKVENPQDAKIVEFAEFMQRYDHTNATIEGHTSAIGAAEYNQHLSERRAKAVVELLVEQYGIARSRLTAVGYGETQLLNDSNTAEAHRMNRRIHAKVSTKVKEKVKK